LATECCCSWTGADECRRRYAWEQCDARVETAGRRSQDNTHLLHVSSDN